MKKWTTTLLALSILTTPDFPRAADQMPPAETGPQQGETLPSIGASGIWIGREELASQQLSGPAWERLQSEARGSCGSPALTSLRGSGNVCVLAKALVHARIGDEKLRFEVVDALRAIVNADRYEGHALSLGRKLGTYAIAADLIDLKTFDPILDARFREAIKGLMTTPTTARGPENLIRCHEERPNNWGTHCGASRAAVAAYLGDAQELARVAQVFKGWLGDRAAYAGFTYGKDRSWQCDPAAPVGINPAGCTRGGHSLDGVIPDDQRRGGRFGWPPPKENYAYEALQGALMQAVILSRAGYEAFEWENRALLRAFSWLHRHARFPASGDDTWQPHVVNYYYKTNFPAPMPSRPGKNVGWTDWTHGSEPTVELGQ